MLNDMIFQGLTIATLTLGATTLGLGFLWIRTREKLIRLQQRTESAIDANARLDRIEAAVETIAVESERLGEVNRFVAQLLSERVAGEGVSVPSGRANPARAVTPH